MYLIVLGAGSEGASLIDLALKDGHEVALIEEDVERARKVLKSHDINVFQGDIAKADLLEEASADRADALIATTSDDSANLMAMFLGKEYEIKTLISMVNHSNHQSLFERLGVHVLTNPEMIIANSLYRMMQHSDND
ncbi:MAG: TrkA family potassium uptake protein [Coleofasciculus chthonoplastes F3-SA18-01]|uniref:potassium channel family protein n=1 Tax=Coleofasciculus chthonoplastes TaxID=64178 RepID=UPI00330552AA